MKKFTTVLLLFCCSCTGNTKRERDFDGHSANQKAIQPSFQDTHPVFKRWNNYYRSDHPGKAEFLSTDTAEIPVIDGSVLPIYDNAFDSVYLPFLVYSPDKTRYIDFDSYQWFLEKGEPQFNVDQEIDLVDVKNKTVRRLAFRGPSAVVEEVYWKDNNTVVLLEIADETTPGVSIVDLKKNQIIHYEATGKVQATSGYFEKRFNRLMKD